MFDTLHVRVNGRQVEVCRRGNRTLPDTGQDSFFVLALVFTQCGVNKDSLNVFPNGYRVKESFLSFLFFLSCSSHLFGDKRPKDRLQKIIFS